MEGELSEEYNGLMSKSALFHNKNVSDFDSLTLTSLLKWDDLDDPNSFLNSPDSTLLFETENFVLG